MRAAIYTRISLDQNGDRLGVTPRQILTSWPNVSARRSADLLPSLQDNLQPGVSSGESRG
jgi:hypothetical protein